MTEEEWKTSDNATVMLEYLRGKTIATPRKLCLITCAGLRLVPSMGPPYLGLIEVAERFMDGLATGEARRDGFLRLDPRDASFTIWMNILRDCLNNPPAGPGVAKQEWWYGAHAMASLMKGTQADSYPLLAHFVRDLFPTPLSRKFPKIPPAWKRANDRLIIQISQNIFDSQQYDQLPVLSDALEEIGCDNAEILAHCRSGGPHIRGCWVVDLLLDKK